MGFVIGTAGHIDHGKSTLVQALTGTDPDRLVEEKRRGITIELGFAQLDLGDGLVASFVDVPGHEALVRTMVAGATGLDAVLLVVAADEGIMPQTREHLDILDLLGIRRGLVALTKADRVDDELLELAELELRETLEESGLADAPILPVAPPTGRGIDELRDALRDLLTGAGGAESDRADEPFRLPIDRVFTMRGFGTVITGSSHGGRVAKGDTLEVQPGGLKVKVRGLQTHGAQVDEAVGSTRLAVNLQGVDKDQLRRGMVLAEPGSVISSSMLDVTVRLLPDAREVDDGSELMVLAGTAETMARIYWIGAEGPVPKQVSGGAELWAQLRLAEPMAVERGERLILRRTAPDRTIGGARVLDPTPRKLKRRDAPARRLLLTALQNRASLSAMAAALARSEPRGLLDPDVAVRRLGVSRAELRDLHSDDLLPLGSGWVHRESLTELADRLAAELSALHTELPLRHGFSREDLKGRLKTLPELLDAAAELLVRDARAVQDERGLRLAGHEVRLNDQQQADCKRIEEQVKKGGFDPPDPIKIMPPESDAPALVHHLLESGRLVRVNRNYLLHKDIHDDLLARVRAHFGAQEEMDTAAFKDMTGLSRKLAIPLLEHLDAIGLTRRRGDVRVARAPTD